MFDKKRSPASPAFFPICPAKYPTPGIPVAYPAIVPASCPAVPKIPPF